TVPARPRRDWDASGSAQGAGAAALALARARVPVARRDRQAHLAGGAVAGGGVAALRHGADGRAHRLSRCGGRFGRLAVAFAAVGGAGVRDSDAPRAGRRDGLRDERRVGRLEELAVLAVSHPTARNPDDLADAGTGVRDAKPRVHRGGTHWRGAAALGFCEKPITERRHLGGSRRAFWTADPVEPTSISQGTKRARSYTLAGSRQSCERGGS